MRSATATHSFESSNGGEDEKLLTHCAGLQKMDLDQRHQVMSEGNLKRLRSTEPEDVKARDMFFKSLNTDKTFPSQVRKGMDGIMIDRFEKKHLAMPKYEEELYLPCAEVVQRFAESVTVN